MSEPERDEMDIAKGGLSEARDSRRVLTGEGGREWDVGAQ